MYVCAELTGTLCTRWATLEEVASDFAQIGLTPEALTAAFAWGFGVVTIFALCGWGVKIVRQVLRDTMRVDDA